MRRPPLSLLLSVVLAAGLLGVIGALGTSTMPSADPASATVPVFNVTCAAVPFVGTLTLTGSAMSGAFSPSVTAVGTTASLTDLSLTTDLEKDFAALGKGKPLTVTVTMAAFVAGGTVTATKLTFTKTETVPATATKTIPATGLVIDAPGTAAPSSFVAGPAGALTVDAEASTAASSPTTTLSMIVNGQSLGPYHCTNVAVPVASTSPVFTITCAGVPFAGTLALTGSVASATLSTKTLTKGTPFALADLALTTNVPKDFAALGKGKPLTVTVHMGAILSGASPAASSLTFTKTETVPATATKTIPTAGLPVDAPGVATPSVFTATSLTGGLTVQTEASTAASSPTTTLSMVVNGQSLGPYHCSNPATLVAAAPLTLSPSSLPAGTATEPYPATAISGRGGTGILSVAIGVLPAGLTFDPSTGIVSGDPAAVGTFDVTVSVADLLGTVDTVAYTLTIKPGNLTLSCTEAVDTPSAAVTTCELTDLAPVVLNGAVQTSRGTMPTLYVRTARRSTTSGWTLTAAMTVTAASLNTNPTCGGAADFCDSSVGPHAATPLRGQIPAKDFEVTGWTCTPAATTTSPAPVVGTAGSLTTAVSLCSAQPGESDGVFAVEEAPGSTAAFQLTVPPYIYSGRYYGTVVYTVVSTR